MKPILSVALGCLASLCLQTSASAVTSVGPPTEPEVFTGTYTPLEAQSDGVLLFGANLPAAYGGQFNAGERSLFHTAPALTPSMYNATVAVPVGATNMRASVFSVYDTTDDLVTLALDNTVAASILGEGFSTVFATAGYNDETTLETAIVNDDTSYLKGFFDTYVSDFPAIAAGATTASGTLVNFSAAALGGTAELNFTPAPEPSTWAALCVGGGSLLLFRRRRTAKA